MFRDVALYRNLLIYTLILPLAVVFGVLLANPLDYTNLGIAAGVLLLLFFPLIMKYHHPFLILSWNASLIIFFLPGKPSLVMLATMISLGFWLLNRTVRRQNEAVDVPVIRNALIFLSIVILVTAFLTKGMGGRAFGSEIWGAKRYYFLLSAIFGYFALTSKKIPVEQAKYLIPIYFLSGITAVGSDIAYAGGSGFYFLFLFFPVEMAAAQIITESSLVRLTGVGLAAMALAFTMVLVYGVRGVLSGRHFWRTPLFFVLIALSFLGGFRSTPITLCIILMLQFWLEGLMRTYLLPLCLGIFILVGGITIANVEKLPLSVQRTLSFLPIEVSPTAKMDAQGTLDWRIEMWKIVLPDVPQYLILGKGYGYSGSDYYLTQESVRRGYYRAYEDTLVSGNYHHGILTTVIPFGIWGLIGFIWFACAGGWVLIRNYRYGRPDFKNYNTFFLSYFIGRLVFFLVLYGQFDMDLMVFTGIVGLSISLNHGVRGPKNLELPEQAVEPPGALTKESAAGAA